MDGTRGLYGWYQSNKGIIDGAKINEISWTMLEKNLCSGVIPEEQRKIDRLKNVMSLLGMR